MGMVDGLKWKKSSVIISDNKKVHCITSTTKKANFEASFFWNWKKNDGRVRSFYFFLNKSKI